MRETEKVKQLRGKILGMELELNLLSKDLTRYKIEFSYNEKLNKDVTENLNFLYSEALIVSLPEFTKAKQQYRLSKMRMDHYRKKIIKVNNVINSINNRYSEEMDIFKEAYKNQFKNNLLKFPKRDNNGRKEKKNS